jgi:hypothetical protein
MGRGARCRDEILSRKGIFNKVADKFKDNILSKGGTSPMILYKRFRGHEPSQMHYKRGVNLKFSLKTFDFKTETAMLRFF